MRPTRAAKGDPSNQTASRDLRGCVGSCVSDRATSGVVGAPRLQTAAESAGRWLCSTDASGDGTSM